MTEISLNALLIVMVCFTVILTVAIAPEAVEVVIQFCKFLFGKEKK